MAKPIHVGESPRPRPGPQNVLVATDFGEPASAAFDYARDLARAFGGRLHVLHVAEDLGATAAVGPLTGMDLGRRQRELEIDARDRLRNLLDDELRSAATETVVMTSNRPATAILRYARDANVDLIVLGTHGRSGFSEFFMGSVAQEVVRRAPCPVLTLRASHASAA
jgi:nucleotide-binding universal stress UspA family protein